MVCAVHSDISGTSEQKDDYQLCTRSRPPVQCALPGVPSRSWWKLRNER